METNPPAIEPADQLANELAESLDDPCINPLAPTDEPAVEPAACLLPPPERTFATRDLLVDFVHQFGISQGYAPTIKRSNADRQVYIHCDRSGVYSDRVNAPDGAKRRKTSTRRQSCPFLVYRSRQKNSNWLLKVKNSAHNHPADDNMIAYPIARQFTPQQDEIIRSLSHTNIKPPYIANILRDKTPGQPIIYQDIYNKRRAVRNKETGQKSILEYLRELLDSEGYKSKFKQDKDGRIEFFLFAHPLAIQLANKYNRVYVLDCTYKTNRFSMPLCHIVGITPSNNTFTIALCFMRNELEISYIWVLETLFNWLSLPPNYKPILITDRDLALLAAIDSI
jgi:hypothetical protein